MSLHVPIISSVFVASGIFVLSIVSFVSIVCFIPFLFSFDLPRADVVVAWLSAVMIGLGTAAGISYKYFRNKQADTDAEVRVKLARADAEAYEIIEKARKGTTMAALEDMASELSSLKNELIEKNNHISELKLSFKDDIERVRRDWALDVQRRDRDLDDCHAEAERLRNISFDFASRVLEKGDYVIFKKDGESDESSISKNPDR
jgi:hypothetical protein